MADPTPLQELEPSPIDSPSDVEKASYFPPSSPPPPHILPHASTASLGLGKHGAVFYLRNIQRYSSYAFTLFLSLHVANTALLPLATRSVSAAEPYLLLTRPYYQSLALEPLLVAAPLALHVAAGVALRLHRRARLAQRYGADTPSLRRRLAWPALSGTAALGYTLAPLVLGHALVNRVVPLYVHGGSSSVGLAFVSHGFARHPTLATLGYAALVGVAAAHVAWGWARWLGRRPEDAPARSSRRAWRAWAINGAAALLSGVWMAGGIGVVGRGGAARGWLGREYDELLERVPLLGGWV